MGRKRRKKLPGHFCWCCGRRRPNERFSGRGHRNHICNACMKLGKEELAYRQHVRNIDRLMTWDGIIRRKTRAAFEPYLTHPDERVRRYANEVVEHNEQRRQALRELYEAELREEERCEQYLTELAPEDEARDETRNQDGQDLGEIPF